MGDYINYSNAHNSSGIAMIQFISLQANNTDLVVELLRPQLVAWKSI